MGDNEKEEETEEFNTRFCEIISEYGNFVKDLRPGVESRRNEYKNYVYKIESTIMPDFEKLLIACAPVKRPYLKAKNRFKTEVSGQKEAVLSSLKFFLDNLRNDDAEEKLKGKVERAFNNWKNYWETRHPHYSVYVFIGMLNTVSTQFKDELGFEPKSTWCTKLATALSQGKMPKEIQKLYKRAKCEVHPNSGNNSGSPEIADVVFKEFESQWDKLTKKPERASCEW